MNLIAKVLIIIVSSLSSVTRANLSDLISNPVNHLPANENPRIYNIGAVLSSGDNIHEFSQVIHKCNFYNFNLLTNI